MTPLIDEGLRGEDLDLALVHKEQALVEEYTNQFFVENPTVNEEDVFTMINSVFNPDSNRHYLLSFGNTATVIANDFEAQGIKFDLRNLDHRIMLGEGVVRERNNAN